MAGGCAQYQSFAFDKCYAYDIRTSQMPWNPPHRIIMCRDKDGPHYYPESSSFAGLAGLLSAPFEWAGNHAVVPVTP